MADHRQPAQQVPSYGARSVAIDTVRRASLIPSEPGKHRSPEFTLPPSPQVVADRLALAHWPWGQQIFVCSLAGGTGRTTVAGLLATVLAEQRFAHLWPPIALREAEDRMLSTTARRWEVLDDPGRGEDLCTRSGAWAFLNGARSARRDEFSAIVVDAAPGLPSENSAVADDPGASVLLLVRPDRASLAEAAEALVWMNDEGFLARQRTVVVINHGSGAGDRGSRAAATALWTRCAAVHSLRFDATLGPGRVLPSGHALPNRVRRVIEHVALDLWVSATTSRPHVVAAD